jgi:glycosyltransferase involved in cell wall biosynthesis
VTDSRPHICFLAPNAYPVLADDGDIRFVGGAELQQVLIARELVHRGYRVSMICLDFGQEDRREVDGVVVHRAFRPDKGLPVLRFVWPRLTSIWGCLKRVNADIVYQRGASMLTGVLAAYCRLHGGKSIFAMAGATKIRFSRDRWLFRYGMRNVDSIVVQNELQRQLVRRETGRQSVLIPNCYKPAVRTRRQGRNVLWVSTIRRVKRPEIFLDVAEALPDYRFTMVGGRDLIDRSLYERIEARAAGLDNVEFVGFVPYAEVHEHFDNAILFVNTSESEGFPNTFLQSWARDIPTVSFVDSGARLNGKQVGRIVASVDDMVSSIRELLEDSSERAHLGQVARNYAENNHGLDRVLDLYEELFSSLVTPRDERVAGRLRDADMSSDLER